MPDPAPTFRELFTPKLLTVLREGYGRRHLRADAAAGLTVAIVALPLSMAIAVASGLSPAAGLYAAIVGGFLVSALGGSRFQIGGPAGAFIVLVAATLHQHGPDGLLLATLLAGVLMLAAGLLRLGSYVKFIPYPVTVGFTAGIAMIILVSQLVELLGLPRGAGSVHDLSHQLRAVSSMAASINSHAAATSVACITAILTLRRWRPHWPGMLLAVIGSSLLVALLGWPVDTVGSRFGGMPMGLPMPSLPRLSLERVLEVAPSALALALLGSIESLLSAVVADGMTGRRHRSNCELAAQGIANVASALFGGMVVTGTIARTATNIRAGAHGPVAGILHAIFLLIFLLAAAPLAAWVPLPALAGVLVVVAWNMVERQALFSLLRMRGESVVVMATFLLTLFRDLTTGILVGFALGTLLFMHRMSRSLTVEQRLPFGVDDQADGLPQDREPYDTTATVPADVLVYRLSGAFFFGSASTVASVLDRIADRPRSMILDFSGVPFLDATAGKVIATASETAARQGVKLVIAGAGHEVVASLRASGVDSPAVRFAPDLVAALTVADGRHGREHP